MIENQIDIVPTAQETYEEGEDEASNSEGKDKLNIMQERVWFNKRMETKANSHIWLPDPFNASSFVISRLGLKAPKPKAKQKHSDHTSWVGLNCLDSLTSAFITQPPASRIAVL